MKKKGTPPISVEPAPESPDPAPAGPRRRADHAFVITGVDEEGRCEVEVDTDRAFARKGNRRLAKFVIDGHEDGVTAYPAVVSQYWVGEGMKRRVGLMTPQGGDLGPVQIVYPEEDAT